MSEWQPIETAPKDGRMLLLWIGDEKPIVGHWHQDDRHPQMTGWDPAEYGHEGCGCCADHMPVPTLWMPLPEPPL